MIIPRSGHTRSINGMKMYYEVCGAGAPVLLLHGGGGIGANWELVFKEPPDGFQMIIPDLRGHGRSDNPLPGFSIRQLAEDVAKLMEELGFRRYQAMGMSLGAKTLLQVATRHPDRLEAMVLVSAAPYFPNPARKAMEQISPDNRTKAEWDQMRQWHVHGDDQIKKIWRQLSDFKNSYEDLNFTPPYLSTITARAFIVHGDRDPLYPVDLALEMYKAIPRASLWVVPDSGHIPVFGKMAPYFAQAALSFLLETENSNGKSPQKSL